MQYAVTVIVEAETLKDAVLKVPDEVGTVASATPRPQTPQPVIKTSSGSVSGSPSISGSPQK